MHVLTIRLFGRELAQVEIGSYEAVAADGEGDASGHATSTAERTYQAAGFIPPRLGTNRSE